MKKLLSFLYPVFQKILQALGLRKATPRPDFDLPDKPGLVELVVHKPNPSDPLGLELHCAYCYVREGHTSLTFAKGKRVQSFVYGLNGFYMQTKRLTPIYVKELGVSLSVEKIDNPEYTTINIDFSTTLASSTGSNWQDTKKAYGMVAVMAWLGTADNGLLMGNEAKKINGNPNSDPIPPIGLGTQIESPIPVVSGFYVSASAIMNTSSLSISTSASVTPMGEEIQLTGTAQLLGDHDPGSTNTIQAGYIARQTVGLPKLEIQEVTTDSSGLATAKFSGEVDKVVGIFIKDFSLAYDYYYQISEIAEYVLCFGDRGPSINGKTVTIHVNSWMIQDQFWLVPFESANDTSTTLNVLAVLK